MFGRQASTLVVADTQAGVRIGVRVMPRSPRTGLDGVRDGRLVIRVTAPPVDRAANDAAVVALARALGLPTGAVRLVGGHTSRNKTVEVAGLTGSEVLFRLAGGGRRS